ncbi:hypothetical protein VTK73DRAFT_8972 [Phialemonium thermophilum]|uniref:Uncharacterized protein n=1 Tax=Phialemonium thermophilum TaxID=223376 RepID=A0ABR3Y534_9PEZI
MCGVFAPLMWMCGRVKTNNHCQGIRVAQILPNPSKTLRDSAFEYTSIAKGCCRIPQRILNWQEANKWHNENGPNQDRDGIYEMFEEAPWSPDVRGLWTLDKRETDVRRKA